MDFPSGDARTALSMFLCFNKFLKTSQVDKKLIGIPNQAYYLYERSITLVDAPKTRSLDNHVIM